MGDLSTLVLDTHHRTTDQPALIAWSARREAARLEREHVRLERIHRARMLDRAAAESLTRPVKPAKLAKPARAVKVRTPKAPRERRGRTYELKIVPCTNCGQATRGANVTLERAPGTVTRRGGLCPDCAPARSSTPAKRRPDHLRPCTGPCGRMTRPGHMRAADAPNTVPRKRQGKCSSCFGGRPPKAANPESIRLCEGTCGRLTRPRGATPHATAVPRVRDGKCSTCITGGGYGPEPKNVDSAAMAADYAAGMSLSQIRAKYDVAKDTATRHIIRAGVPMRPAPANIRRAAA